MSEIKSDGSLVEQQNTWRILCLFHSWYFLFSTYNSHARNGSHVKQTFFSKKKKGPAYFIAENLKCKYKGLEKTALFRCSDGFVHAGNERWARSVLSSEFMSNGQAGSCGSTLPCQQQSGLLHYINFLFLLRGNLYS